MSYSQPLALKYRPRTFNDIVGQKAVRVVLSRMIQTGQVPGGLFLFGQYGSGKTSTARLFASALNCEQEDVTLRPCGVCTTCISIVNDRSTDVTEIDAASSGRAEDMRALREAVRFAPVRRYRVVVLDECHSLSPAGFQALLKVLEEPPPNVVFVLATTNRDKVPDTILSRCFGLEFKRITESDMVGRLLFIARGEGFPLSGELAAAIAARSRGALRDAVMLLEQAVLVGVRSPEQLVSLLGDTDVEVRLVSALVRGDLPEAFEWARTALEGLPSPRDLVARVVVCLRRVLVLSSLQGGAAAGVVSPPATFAETALAAAVAPVRAVAALRVVWEYYRSVAPVAEVSAAVDLLVVMLGGALFDGGPSHVVDGTSLGVLAVPNTLVGSSSPMSVEDILASAATRSVKGG